MTVGGIVQPGDSLLTIVRGLVSAQKSSRGAASYSRWVNRPMGRFFAACAFKLGATPNQVTAVAAVFTFVGVTLLVVLPATIPTGAIVALLLVLGYAFDAADGQLARLRGGGSPSGEWLDHVIDCVKCSVLHLVVAVAWYRFFDLPAVLMLVPLVYAAESAIWFFTIMLTDQLRRGADGVGASTAQSVPGRDERPQLLRSVIVTPVDYGVLCLSFALWGLNSAFVGVYTALMIINVAVLGLSLIRWYREMARLGTNREVLSEADLRKSLS